MIKNNIYIFTKTAKVFLISQRSAKAVTLSNHETDLVCRPATLTWMLERGIIALVGQL